MRRGLTIAKYVPAVLCGLLVVAWVVSVFVVFGAMLPMPNQPGVVAAVCEDGSLVLIRNWDAPSRADYYANWTIKAELRSPDGLRSRAGPAWLGNMGSSFAESHFAIYRFPILVLVTLLLPLALGPFIRFRFPLWSWFAFTALVAVELAYYLR